jgi:hypothetical protein
MCTYTYPKIYYIPIVKIAKKCDTTGEAAPLLGIRIEKYGPEGV